MATDIGSAAAHPLAGANDSAINADQHPATPEHTAFITNSAPEYRQPPSAPPTTSSEPPPGMAQQREASMSSNGPQDKDEADTCRICRGESTPEEPLFFPCKCSGSIKYVHQECLMEWLSHSQKKYCELCKTSFRFTKLYHPGMPSRIPTSVFIRRAAVHIFKLFMTWCRAVLVASVWLVLLPWCMRVVWRSLFWVGDGAWTREDYIEAAESRERAATPSPLDLDGVRSAVEAAKAANTSFALPLPSLMMPFSQTLNMSGSDYTVWTLFKRFFLGVSDTSHPSTTVGSANWTIANSTTNHLGSRSPSLLSNIPLFHCFPSQAANRFLIDVLEGQIITLLVVVAFILIFLIREWVVQQQPVINMVALGDDAVAQRAHAPQHDDEDDDEEEEDPPMEVAAQPRRIIPDDADEHALEDDDEETRTRRSGRTRRSSSARRRSQAVFKSWQDSDDVPEELRQALSEGSPEDIARIIDQMPEKDSRKLKESLVKLSMDISRNRKDRAASPTDRAQPEALEDEASNSRGRTFPDRASSLAYDADSRPEHSPGSRSPSRRPHMPTRVQSSIATEIRRSLEEGNAWSFADVPPESKDETEKDEEEGEVDNVPVPDSWEDDATNHIAGGVNPDQKTIDQEHGSDHSSESWQQVPTVIAERAGPDLTKDKGKAKASEEDSDDLRDPLPGPPGTEAGSSIPPTDVEAETRAISNASFHGSDSDRAELANVSQIQDEMVPNPQPDSSSRRANEPVQEQAPNLPPPQGIRDGILEWVYGDIAPDVSAGEDVVNEEHIVQDLADEAPFVPHAVAEPHDLGDPLMQDPEVAAAAAQAGIDVNDQDAIDDAEDLEGILELIGMQGPLMGLFQNAMFSAVLISATLACAVWLPYLWGKVVILFMGSPISLFVKLPLQLIAALADLVVDGALCLAAGAVYLTLAATLAFTKIGTLGWVNEYVERPIGLIAGPAYSIAASAANRLKTLVLYSPLIPPPTYFRLSVNSHVALRTIQNTTSHTLNQTSAMVNAFCENVASETTSEVAYQFFRQVPASAQSALVVVSNKTAALFTWVLTAKSYKITFDLDTGRHASTLYAAMEQWSAMDRLIAVLAGYAFFAVAGAVYLKRGAPFSSSQQGQRIERIVADVLQQAGGVLKVILIISIEMLVFPLYCGLLLDLALLPLFRDANMYSRWQFARANPWTSGFVHWFIGTCYMFHFALFVSMCRKILRRGVLYFIRDPDDPTFHPVRDVLERSVTTQLRKIAFSALVYGALVIMCLGGVVWGLGQFTTGVLPIQWVSHAPSLEFPLDLLFYNFLTPVIIKMYKPSDGLHVLSQWWFKRCARFLRMSNFLFGDRAKDEEGRTGNSHVITNGRLVRAPASDQVRIPKGEPVFVDVDENNNRKDGKPEVGGVHNSDLVTQVYIPPWFRVRIAIFVFTIWIFAAITGISATIIPLLFGRYLFSLCLPRRVEMNDIHAFSLGVYTLGSIFYTAYQAYSFVRNINRPVPSPLATLYTIAATASRISLRILKFAYVWVGLIAMIPLLFAVLIELYFLMPLHAYLGPSEPHVVHIIQDWTLGFLYARLAARLIFSDRASRSARAFSAVIANGYLKPNAKIATRCFLLPALAMFAIAIAAPSFFALSMNKTLYYAADDATKAQVWRFCYPAVGLAFAAFWAGREGINVVTRWRLVVRDEVYLIGERLHNFGEKKAPRTPIAQRSAADTGTQSQGAAEAEAQT